MQILPHAATELLPTFTFAAVDDDRTSQFMDIMNSALEDDEEQETEGQPSAEAQAPSVDAEAVRGAAMVSSPYSRHTANGITYTLDEVCFTKQELQDLCGKLAKGGAPADALERLQALAELPEGATLGQVMAGLKGENGDIRISDEDKGNIESLCKKLDPSGVLGSNLLDLMQQGQGREALDMLLGYAGQNGEEMDLTKAEALSLGRGLGLGKSSLQALLDGFGGNDALTGPAAALGQVLAPASDFFTSQAANRQSLDKALKDTLQPMISAARARTEKERKAGALQDHEAQQSRAYIDRTVQRNTRDILEDTLAKGQDEEQRVAAQGTPDSPFAPQAQGAQDARERGGNGRQADGWQGQDGRQDARQDAAQGEAKPDGWQELLQKVEARPSAARGGDAAQFAGNAAQQPGAAPDARAPSQAAPLNRQIAHEITQGALTALRDGKRMDLQISSQELGAITVTVTLRNGEVSARLRAEKPESVEALQQQMDAVRAALEDQGLKVDKVEVALENRDDQNMLWQELDQHNARQEENARREELARIRNLAITRRSSANRDNAALAQPMLGESSTAQYAPGALNLVA